MLLNITFYSFVAASLSLLIYGFRSRTGMLQYPFLMGTVFVCYLLYQALGMFLQHGSIPTGPFAESLLMLTFCCLGCMVGYKFRPLRFIRPQVRYKPQRLLIGGLLLIVIAWFGYYKLTSLTGGFLSFFSTEGGYSYTWSGLPVRYNFFVAMVYPGLILCLVAYEIRPSRKAFVICVLGMILPFAYIVLMGRRSIAAWLVLTLLLHLYWSRRYLPPRAFIAVFLFFGLLALYVGPKYRSYSQLGADHSQILNISVKESLSQALDPEKIDAFKNGVYVVGAFSESGNYGYGAIFYDQLVINFVPRQLFGDELRSSLMLGGGYEFIDKQTARTMIYYRPANQFLSGHAELYSQFSYFGCLYFVLLGVIFKTLWIRSTTYSSPTCRILYMSFIIKAMISVAFSPSAAPAQTLMQLFIIIPILWWSKEVCHNGQPSTNYISQDVYNLQELQICR